MNEFHQFFPVIEVLRFTDREIRIDALVRIVQGTVSDNTDLSRTGNREYGSAGCRAGTDNAGTAAAGAAEQRYTGGSFE